MISKKVKRPRGRPPGTRNPDEVEKLLRDIRANAPLLRRKLVQKALAGDVEAIRLCIERLDLEAARAAKGTV